VTASTHDAPPGAAIPYTPAQLEAIGSVDGNLQIVACAGSGKTQVISERVAEILERKRADGITPRNIVAFTFTDRAAAALKDRISTRIRARFGEVTGLADMYVGTIHGYCLQLLQGYVPEYFKYQVLTEVQTRLLVDRNFDKCGMKGLGLKRWVESKLFIDVVNMLREADVDPQALAGHPTVDALAKYEALLSDKRFLDYASIMANAVRMVENDPQIRNELAARVKYLVVDEYQDVNPLQERLIRALHNLGAQVCVCGDDDQTLYQFRGSEIRNILDFSKRYPGVRSVTIDDNFRSSSGVVDLARSVIAANDPDRLLKVMQSAGNQDFARGDILCQQFPDDGAEAQWIAARIKAMVGMPFIDEPGHAPRGLALSDFAILLRSVKGNGGPILAALKAAGLGAVVVGFNNLFERPEIQAAVALFGYFSGAVTETDLASAWKVASVGYSDNDWVAALTLIRKRKTWPQESRRALYTLQRTFLDFLTALSLREERVPSTEGEIIYYNFGKFSQVISDYEQIHFHSEPAAKHDSFYRFLISQAPGYYPEGAQDQALVRPDAVQVMTVHQAKGLEWPVVFVPALLRNRFPAAGVGGKSVWHVLPQAAVRNAAGYRGGLPEERRVLYVALTRSQRFLYCSFGPVPGNRRFQRASDFVAEITRTQLILTRPPAEHLPPPLRPSPKRSVTNMGITFSQFKYFKECPYQFKLRFLYGFNAPLEEALGYGKSLHDTLAEIHKQALAGTIPTDDDVPDFVRRHLHVPFAYPKLRDALEAAAIRTIGQYLGQNRGHLNKLEHAEQVVELELGDGIIVNGRIDLIRHTDTGEIAVVDFKSNERSQDEDVSRTQLHIYTVGYRALTGRSADLIEVHELERGRVQREIVDEAMERTTLAEIGLAAASLRSNHLPRLASWSPKACGRCDFRGICRETAVG